MLHLPPLNPIYCSVGTNIITDITTTTTTTRQHIDEVVNPSDNPNEDDDEDDDTDDNPTDDTEYESSVAPLLLQSPAATGMVDKNTNFMASGHKIDFLSMGKHQRVPRGWKNGDTHPRDGDISS